MDEGLRLLLSLSLSGTLLAGLTALVMVPLRRRAPRAFCYYLWLLVLLRFLCPMGADRSLSNQAVVRTEPLWAVTGDVQEAMISNSNKGKPLDTSEPSVNVSLSLTAVWAGGALLVLGGRLWGIRRLRKELARTQVPVQPWEYACYQAIAGRAAGVPELVRTSGSQPPMLAGLLRPHIYLPMVEMPAEALDCALRHELVHWRRKDLWYKYLTAAVTALHWFNPAIWLLARAVDRDCELSCDEAVARTLSREGRAYGRTLLWAAANQNGLSGGLAAPLWTQKQCLKERLHAIMRPNQNSKLAKCLLTAAVILVAAASAALGAYTGVEAPEVKLPEMEPAQSVMDALAEQTGETWLAWPFEDTEEISISNLYGGRSHPVTGELTQHTGIDIVLEEETPVLASAAGTIHEIRFTAKNGNYVVIDHGNGMTTRYGCLEKNDFVQVGDTVEAGAQIGTVGRTGTATGYHLHFEVTVDGNREDPLDHLPHGEVFIGKKDETTPLIY